MELGLKAPMALSITNRSMEQALEDLRDWLPFKNAPFLKPTGSKAVVSRTHKGLIKWDGRVLSIANGGVMMSTCTTVYEHQRQP